MKFKIGDKVRIKDSIYKTRLYNVVWEIMEIVTDRDGNEYVTLLFNTKDEYDRISKRYSEDELEFAYNSDEAFAEVQEFEKEREREKEEKEKQNYINTRLEEACMGLTNLEIELEHTDIKLKDYRLIEEYMKAIRFDITELWQDWVDAKY